MTQDNSSTSLDNQGHQIKYQFTSFYFKNKLEKLPESNW